MIKFILKGILRDRSRSFFPILTVTIGVIVTIFLYTYMTGFSHDLIETNAKFQTGHVSIVTRAYAELIDQKPHDLALLGTEDILSKMKDEHPQIEWAERIYFGGLIDVPDEEGETKEQTFFSGMAIDLHSPESIEHRLLEPEEAIIRGRPAKGSNEILVSDQLAESLKLEMGDEITLISDTMEGSMTFGNFRVVGTVSFGVEAFDRNALLADINEVRPMLDMEDAANELLGFLPAFDEHKVNSLAEDFNKRYSDEEDEFSPKMLSILDYENIGDIYAYTTYMDTLFISGFILIMSIVLWNAGLMNGIRRYGEIGVRLAIGEDKLHLYRVMIYEAILIGLAGTIIGTALGLVPSYYMQNVGIDVGGALSQEGMFMSDILRSKVTTSAYFVGLIPGLLATTLGAALAGTGIIKRNTAQLFKELET